MNTINSVPGDHDRNTNASKTIKDSFAGSAVDTASEKKNGALRIADAGYDVLQDGLGDRLEDGVGEVGGSEVELFRVDNCTLNVKWNLQEDGPFRP